MTHFEKPMSTIEKITLYKVHAILNKHLSDVLNALISATTSKTSQFHLFDLRSKFENISYGNLPFPCEKDVHIHSISTYSCRCEITDKQGREIKHPS